MGIGKFYVSSDPIRGLKYRKIVGKAKNHGSGKVIFFYRPNMSRKTYEKE